MAVANWGSSATMKAVLLPLILVLLAVAAGASSAEDGGAVVKSGGRFSETPGGRKLLQFIQLCGPGSAPDYSCKVLLPTAKNATCCSDLLGNRACVDVGGFLVTKCGSCTNACKVGELCCSGVCANLKTDKNNCGICGHKCAAGAPCKLGFCGY